MRKLLAAVAVAGLAVPVVANVADAATGCTNTYHGSYSVSYRCHSGAYRAWINYKSGTWPHPVIRRYGPCRYDWDPSSTASVPYGGQPITAYGLDHGCDG